MYLIIIKIQGEKTIFIWDLNNIVVHLIKTYSAPLSIEDNLINFNANEINFKTNIICICDVLEVTKMY